MLGFFVQLLYTQLVSSLVAVRVAITGKSNPFAMTLWVLQRFAPRFRLVKGSAPLLRGPIMVLANHRSWTDFFVDQVLSGGGSYLARMMVAVGVPGAAFWAWVTGCTWFFQRRSGIQRDEFTQWFKSQWASTRPHAPVIVYPEGHRNTKPESLKLKTGCLQVAYALRTPVQVVITTNKERIVNEKTLRISYGVDCAVYVSQPLRPEHFETLDAWFAAIRQQWEDAWRKAYAAAPADSEPLTALPLPGVPRPEDEAAPPHRVRQLRAVLLALALALVGLAARWL